MSSNAASANRKYAFVIGFNGIGIRSRLEFQKTP
jgi:hypothetical protein